MYGRKKTQAFRLNQILLLNKDCLAPSLNNLGDDQRRLTDLIRAQGGEATFVVDTSVSTVLLTLPTHFVLLLTAIAGRWRGDMATETLHRVLSCDERRRRQAEQYVGYQEGSATLHLERWIEVAFKAVT